MNAKEQDFYLEGMTMLAMSRDPSILDTCSPRVAALVYENKIAWNRLMLGLAVKLEAGVKPGVTVK